jgi:rod shape-determining protein MreD
VGSFLSLPVLLLAVALQTSFVPQVRFWDGAPDLVFLVVLAWSVQAPLEESVTWALVGGILQDLASIAPLGLSSVGLVLLVFAVHYLTRQIHRVGLITLAGLALAGTLFQQMMVWLLFGLWGFRVDFLDDFNFVIIPTIIYNLALIWPVYGLVRLLQRRLTEGRRITT